MRMGMMGALDEVNVPYVLEGWRSERWFSLAR